MVNELHCWLWWRAKEKTRRGVYIYEKDLDEIFRRIVGRVPHSIWNLVKKTMEEQKLLRRIDRYKFEVLENTIARKFILKHVSPIFYE